MNEQMREHLKWIRGGLSAASEVWHNDRAISKMWRAYYSIEREMYRRENFRMATFALGFFCGMLLFLILSI